MAGESSARPAWRSLPAILALAGPTMLEQLMQTAVQYIDTAMVGTLGKQAVAAVGSTTTINWLLSGSVGALGVGFLAFISRAFGAKREEEARRASAQAMLFVLLLGGIFTAVTMGCAERVPVWMQVDPAVRGLAARYFRILYAPMLFRTASILCGTVLRAAGETRTPMRMGILINAVNVVMNFFLIYETRTVTLFGHALTVPGAGWGVEGAAAASAASFVIGGVGVFAALWRHPRISPRGMPHRV